MTDDTKGIDQQDDFHSLARAAEQILSQTFGSTIHFTNIERLSEPDRRNLILRCTSGLAGDFPSSFILKKVEAESYQPDNPDSWDTQRFFSGWVGSQFLSSLGNESNHGPQFYGGSREIGFILLEDLGQHRSLVETLLHEDGMRAEAALLRYSARLGKLHADTVNRMNTFEKLWHAVNPSGQPFMSKESEFEHDIHQLQQVLNNLGVATETNFSLELGTIVTAILNPGPFLAYIHGDPCPDNVFDSSTQLRLIDFEFGRFGHALIDATYGRMIFPTCWCANRLLPTVVHQMESQYRTELIRGCSQAQEDKIFEEALVTVCGFWLLHTLVRHLEPALEEDHDWGIASLRQRVLTRLEAFITTSKEFGYFPALRSTAGRLLDSLVKRWPEVVPLPVYPAFQG